MESTLHMIVRASVGVLVRRGDEVLLMRRRGGNAAGTWAAPGGKVDAGETCAAAACRELEEETGLVAPYAVPLGAWSDYTGRDAQYVILWYYAPEWFGEPTIREPDKCDGLGWFGPDAMPAPLAPFTPDGLAALARR